MKAIMSVPILFVTIVCVLRIHSVLMDIMNRIKDRFERFAKSKYKGLGTLTKEAEMYPNGKIGHVKDI